MPKITIQEADLTKATNTVGTDIAYIPGFAGYTYKQTEDTTISDSKDYFILTDGEFTQVTTAAATDLPKYYEKIAAKTYGPTLCNSIEDFKEYFGTEPYKFAAADLSLDVAANDIDRSYVMAIELLNLKMPIYYDAVNVKLDDAGDAERDDTADFYEVLVGTESVTGRLFEIEDKGEYTIKYITS